MTSQAVLDQTETACRRARPRQRVLLAGKVVLPGGLSPDCTIRNLTETGAQIRVAPGQALPDEFHLIEIRSGMAWRAHVAWRTPSATGVTFSERVDLSVAGAPLQLRTLWLGCAQRGVGVSEG